MIRVLHIVSSLGGGGVESMLYNYYSNIDNEKIRFDFIVHGDNIGLIEEKVEAMGSIVYHVTPKKTSFKDNMLEIENVIKNGNYDVVHCHQNFSNFSSLYLAWKHKVPVRISHAHGCKEVKNIVEKMKQFLLRSLNKLFANYFFSCGLDAGKWLHGKGWSPSKKNILMNNAIDVDKFSYSEEVRQRYRKKLNVKDKKVLLHVGRFSDEKNHLFMVDIMEQLSKENSEYILLLVGNGATEKLVKRYVEEKKISNSIIFMGVRNDVAELMNSADIFLFPSKNEGLGITVIEAQATGLPVIASDRVPIETRLTKLIDYLPIDDINIWTENIINSPDVYRKSQSKKLEKANYSIDVQSEKYGKWLEDIF